MGSVPNNTATVAKVRSDIALSNPSIDYPRRAAAIKLVEAETFIEHLGGIAPYQPSRKPGLLPAEPSRLDIWKFAGVDRLKSGEQLS